MAEPSSSGTAFGSQFTGETPPDESWLQDEPGGDPTSPEGEQAPAAAPSGEQAPAGAPPETPAEAAAPPEAGGAETEDGGAAAPAEQFMFAGRQFPDMAVAEQSYQHMQGLQTRTAQQLQEANQRMAEYEQALREIQPYLPQLQSLVEGGAQPAPLPGQAPPSIDWSKVDWNDPTEAQKTIEASMAAQAAKVAEERLAQFRADFEAQQTQSQQEAAAQAQMMQYQQKMTDSITKFREAHPDIAANSPADLELAQFIGSFSYDGRPVIDISDLDQLELALEMQHNPALAKIIEVNPLYAATENGRELARQFASTSTNGAALGAGAPAQGQQPGEARPAVPHVETGGSGAPGQPAPGDQPEDEFAAVMALGDRLRNSEGRAFFGG